MRLRKLLSDLPLAILVLVFVLSGVMMARSIENTSSHPLVMVAEANFSGVQSAEPVGQWVTSSWPTTRYYTSKANPSVWRKWATYNRVWFDTEVGLLSAYPNRERK